MTPNETPDWWLEYLCEECGATTRASALPNYCPVCGEWGLMLE